MRLADMMTTIVTALQVEQRLLPMEEIKPSISENKGDAIGPSLRQPLVSIEPITFHPVLVT